MTEPVLTHDGRCPIWKGAPVELCRCQGEDGYTPRGPWSEAPMLAFDVESTGVDVHEDRIVTATLVIIQPGSPLVRTWLADPGIAIPAEASAVHGITEEYAAEHGRPAAEVVDEIDRALAAEWDPDTPLVAMNASFDLSMLDAELRRHHNRRLRIAGPVIDPLVIDKHVEKYRKGSRKLEALCERWRVRLDGAHDATEDALAAARVAWRIAHDVPDIGGADLADLHADQIGWYAAQQRSFAKYLRDKVAPGIDDPDERADVLARADQADAAAGNWPMRGVS